MLNPRLILAAALLAAGLSPAAAHEFWIAPQSYTVGTAGRIIADFRVGQDFEGEALPYLPFAVSRLDLESGGQSAPVTARLGDIPAIDIEAPGEGLAEIAFASTGGTVEYRDMDEFAEFLTSKGLDALLDQHRARGLPETDFFEFYRRFSKVLVAVGDGAGADSELGLDAEIVAGANPYTDDLSGGLEVRVLYEGAPHGDARIDVFARDAAGDVSHTLAHTDAGGRATVAVTPGSEYLIATVVVRPAPPSDDPEAPVWESLWASLTFEVPDQPSR